METLIFIGVVVSICVSIFFAVQSVNLNKEIEDTVRSKLDSIIREVNVETHKGITYWFDKENDKFLAQGETLDEIRAVLKQRFPKNIFVLGQNLYVGPEFNPVTLDKWKEQLQGMVK